MTHTLQRKALSVSEATRVYIRAYIHVDDTVQFLCYVCTYTNVLCVKIRTLEALSGLTTYMVFNLC